MKKMKSLGNQDGIEFFPETYAADIRPLGVCSYKILELYLFGPWSITPKLDFSDVYHEKLKKC
jgi:hypothetical protein